MNRLYTLFVVLVVLVLGYLGLRWYSQPGAFQAPAALEFSSLDVAAADQLRLVFPEGKQVELRKISGQWKVSDFPADASKVDQLINSLKGTKVVSRVSSNKQYHDRFDVSDKGIKFTVLEKDTVKSEFIVGKPAGGDAVYVRLPDQNDVYVMNGLPRYTLQEDPEMWRDRAIASFAASNVRRVQYTENQIDWDLQKVSEGWVIGTKRIAATPVDAGKTDAYLQSVVGLRATEFASQDQVNAAKKNRSTFADVVVEVGTLESFERKETWRVYSVNGESKYLIVRESDGLGFYVALDSFDQVFSDFGAVKQKLVLTEEEKKAKEAGPETK